MNGDTFDLILDAIQRCAAPIWASDSRFARPTSVNDNGTCGFVDTGERRLLLTAYHVLKAFREKRAETADAVLAINLGAGCTVALNNPEVLDEHEELDIAILSFPDLDERTGHDKQYFPIRAWPIATVHRGDAIALIGFPGARRTATGTIGSFEPVGFGMVVSSASDQSIVLADESGTFRTVTRDGSLAASIRLGGFSGSPAFLVHPSGPQVVGIFRAGPNDDTSETGTVVFLSPTRYLRSNGTLDRGLLPPFPPRCREM